MYIPTWPDVVFVTCQEYDTIVSDSCHLNQSQFPVQCPMETVVDFFIECVGGIHISSSVLKYFQLSYIPESIVIKVHWTLSHV